MAGRHCSTGTWVAQCTAEEMHNKNREKTSLGAKSELGIWNLGLTGQTAKAPKNEHTMQKRMCWDATGNVCPARARHAPGALLTGQTAKAAKK
jgi:hypothetical protein